MAKAQKTRVTGHSAIGRIAATGFVRAWADAPLCHCFVRHYAIVNGRVFHWLDGHTGTVCLQNLQDTEAITLV